MPDSKSTDAELLRRGDSKVHHRRSVQVWQDAAGQSKQEGPQVLTRRVTQCCQMVSFDTNLVYLVFFFVDKNATKLDLVSFSG